MRATLSLSLLLSSLLSLPFTTSSPVNSTLISHDIKVRDASTLPVTTYLKRGCKGTKYENPYVQYSSIYPATPDGFWAADPLNGQRMQSYHLSRALDPSEQLEFSVPVLSNLQKAGIADEPANPCGDWFTSAPIGEAGCHNVKEAVYLKLKHH